MAITYKKITEVAALAALNEGDELIINSAGALKRAPKSLLGLEQLQSGIDTNAEAIEQLCSDVADNAERLAQAQTDIGEIHEALAQVSADCADCFRGTATGTESIVIDDISPGNPRLRSLTITGNSVQTGTPTPENPIAIHNVGDPVASGEHVGKYSIPLILGGKNLFDETYESGNLGDLGENSVNSAFTRSKNFIDVVPGTTLKFSNAKNYGMRIVCYYNNGVMVQRDSIYPIPATVTVPMNANQLRFAIVCGDCTAVGKSQLEVGTEASAYEPYCAPAHVDIYLDAPLRQGETLDLISGQLVRRRAVIAAYNGESVGDAWISSTGALTTGATVEYALATPIVEDIGGQNLGDFTPEHTTVVAVGTSAAPTALEATYNQDPNVVVGKLAAAIVALGGSI